MSRVAKSHREIPSSMWGQPKYGKPSPNAKPLEEEYGWLTPIRKSVGDPLLWFFKCRCGAEVLRGMAQARRNLKNGRVSKCSPKCPWKG